MAKYMNIERNKLDYILTDIMPVEVSELFSYGKFYEFLLDHQKKLNNIVREMLQDKSKGEIRSFNGKWSSTPLKYNILKGVDGFREINLVQPISALNIYFFVECYQKEILDYLENNNCFSLRYHKKNNDLYYKRKTNRQTEYFVKTSKKMDKSILQQTGAYFKLYKFNSVSSFTNSKLWKQCNFKYKYFAKVDYKSCFPSIYTHTYKWIIERNTIDSKDAKNSNLFIIIDRILQNINGKSSNGIIVGPEFSRMIAEILLQNIDKEVLQNLLDKGLSLKKDFRIFRYVDDIYIFANSPVDIDNIINIIESTAQKYLLHLNELKSYTTQTPVIMNDWLYKTRIFSDKVADLFYKKSELYESQSINYLVKNRYISLDRLENEFTLLMNEFTKERRFIVSYILSTLLNNISSKKDGFKLFDDGKLNKDFVILELAFYIYSFCPCFEHSQRMISMLVYFDDELKFKKDDETHKRLRNIIRKYSFIFEQANINDICNWFVFFNEYKISLLNNSEDLIFKKVISEDNPILLANYLIYSRYDKKYHSIVLKKVESIIDDNISNMLPCELLLQREFWYVLVFCNCPYISDNLKDILAKKVEELKSSYTNPSDLARNLIYEFLKDSTKKNLFFYWGYYNFSASKQLTYRTYQRTLFKQYRNSTEMYGSLDS